MAAIALPLSGVATLVAVWQLGIALSPETLVPSPGEVAAAIGELATSGLLVRYAVASLFRVTWGYLSAVAIALPLGMWLGLSRHAEEAVGPLLQIIRPISPLAWIPLTILWFGVGDLAAMFLIFLASLLPLTVTVVHAVREIDPVHLRAAINFGSARGRLLNTVVVPAILPQVVVGLRIALGIAWLVVVAAEMLAVNSGLGFLIVDARNAGNRYDLVVAGMVLIGVIGVGLDLLMRRLERLESVRWGFAETLA